MSTLGTFSQYADFNFFQDAAKGLGKIVKKAKNTGASANKKVKKVVNSARRAVEPGYKAKQDLAKGVRNRNIMIGAGLGTAGLGTAGAIALSNRKKNANMSGINAYSSFAKKTYGEVTDAMRAGSGSDLSADQLAKIKAVKDNKQKLDADQLKEVQKRAGDLKSQRSLEKAVDAGKDTGKASLIARGAALAGSPERDLIRSGKASDKKWVKGLAEGAEKFGKLGYKSGATGARGVLNKVVGRTGTGKIARLGAAGAGIAAIGGAMKRKREDQY